MKEAAATGEARLSVLLYLINKLNVTNYFVVVFME